MCGILGFVGPTLPDPARFGAALDTLHRRGPDDRGVYADQGAMLGHTRLAIVDLSADGHQPMFSADRRFVTVFNGEVYNFRELRAELEKTGVQIKSHCDTEVILELFAREGLRCVERFRGMFAIAIWDTREQTLTLIRDRMGIKPLYVAHVGGSLAFASEVKALRALGAVSGRLNPHAAFEFLAWGSVPSPVTILDGIISLPPGSWARWKNGAFETGSYWGIPGGPSAYRTRAEAIEALRPALLKSVSLRCIADVPLGAFLSGGIDSSSVVSLMRAVGQRDLHTFALTFPGTELDEAAFAQEIAQRYETRHTAVPIEAPQVREVMDDFFSVLDQPTCDGINTYLVSRFAKQAGLTVALSGLGGDEIFGGYPSFRRAQRVGPWAARMPPELRALAGHVLAPVHPRLAKLEGLTLEGHPLAQLYFASRGLFSPSQVQRLLGRDLVRAGARPDAHTLPPTLASARSPFHVTMALELRRYMHDQLLRDSDVFGMAHALEIRVPLIDHKVVEIVARTPAEMVLAGGNKALLRDALPTPLPEACTNRRKMGFTFPFDRWLRTNLRPELEAELLADRPGQLLDQSSVTGIWREFLAGKLHWSRPWSLYVFRRWAREAGALNA